MIVENLVHFIGALVKHVIGVLLLCWRRMLRAGVITFFIGVIVTFLVAVIGTGKAFPGVYSVIVAVLLGVALAYGVALTVFISEFVLGVIDLIRMLEGDAASAAHITEVVAERELGQVGQGLRRLIGLPTSKRAPGRVAATVPPLSRVVAASPARASANVATEAVVGAGVAAAAKAALAATHTATPPDNGERAPAARSYMAAANESVGEPVPASRLPRIAWTYEHEAIKLPKPDADATPAPTAEPEPQPAPAPVAPSASAVEPVAAAVTSVAPEPIIEVTPTGPATSAPIEPAPAAAESEPTSAEEPAATTEEASAPAEAAPMPADGAPHAAHFPFHLPESVSALGSALPQGALEAATGIAVSHLMDALTHHGVGAGPAAPLEADYADERLAAPTTVTTPEGPAEPAERVDEPADEEAPISATESAAPAAPAASHALETPIPPATPAPATTPLPIEPAEPAAQAEPPATETTAMTEPATTEPMPEPETEATQTSATAAASPEAAPEDAAEEAPETPAGRPDSVRRTLPLGSASAEAALDRTVAPRASAPESGLWERLSSALINRSGAPSGPFAPAPPSSDEPDANSSGETSPEE